MKSVFTLVCILSAVHYATASCSAVVNYTTQLLPTCDVKDVYIKWPNYPDQTTFYWCDGVGNPVLTPCPSGQYFCYVYQQCVPCKDYIPPVQCKYLKTQNTPNCVPMGTVAPVGTSAIAPTSPVTGYPTPYYPTGTTSTSSPPIATPPAISVSTEASASSTAVGPPGPPVATPPNVTNGPDSSTTAFPGPPSPVTSNPNVPMPPTPAPTPPVLDEQPPTAGASSG